MAPHLNIVASCTDRKRGVIPDERRLGAISAGEPGARAERWWKRLTSTMPLFGIEASQVYVGEHWSLVQKLTANLRQAGWRVNLWITSAGYGLLSEQAPIYPYSATFSEESPDTVAVGCAGSVRSEYHQDWWDALARLRAGDGTPTRLADLAKADPASGMLLLASPDYVRAMQDDLLRTAEHMRSEDRLAIFTSDSGWSSSPLHDNLVLTDERTRSVWGGSMQGLHARTALNLLTDARRGAFSANDLRAKYTRMVGDAPKPQKPKREKRTDSEVADFIRAELLKNPKARHSPLLTLFRSKNWACEQSRFRELYDEISSSFRADDQSRETGET